jgi:hypothetical protein
MRYDSGCGAERSTGAGTGSEIRFPPPSAIQLALHVFDMRRELGAAFDSPLSTPLAMPGA